MIYVDTDMDQISISQGTIPDFIIIEDKTFASSNRTAGPESVLPLIA